MEQFAYQIEKPLSNRDIMEMAAGQIKVEGLTDTQKQALQTFKAKLEKQRELWVQRNQLQQIRDTEKAKGKSVRKANAQIAELSRRIQTLENEIVTAEDSELYKNILKKARKTVEQMQREAFQKRLEKYKFRSMRAGDQEQTKYRNV